MEKKEQNELTDCLNKIKISLDDLIEQNKKLFEENENIVKRLDKECEERKKIQEKYDKECEERKKIQEKFDKEGEERKKIQEKLDKEGEERRKMQEKFDKECKKNDSKINELNEKINDLKDILGDIQSRDQAKNFLNFFKRYLTDEDKKIIDEDYTKKGEIIIKRFENKFEKYTDNSSFTFIKKLIEYSTDLLDSGNNYAHSLTLDNYRQEIKEFKKDNNITILKSPEIFCYCINLGLGFDKKMLYDAYCLFEKYFKSLIIKREKIKIFESYIIN